MTLGSESHELKNVSDTALWVAVYRADETERADALFQDPFAKVLAGERGPRIVNKMKQGRQMAFVIVVRTKVLDEMILETIEKEQIDTVVNLAAGLDSRPYRMALPSSLTWIEVDLPGIIEYKTEKLKEFKPVCRLERVVQDLSDGPGRSALFAKIRARSKNILVITEGLLIYLPEENVVALARDLRETMQARRWILDFATAAVLKMIRGRHGKNLRNAPMVFGVDDRLLFFEKRGWKPEEIRYSWPESLRLNRAPPYSALWKFLMLFTSHEKKLMYTRMSGMAKLAPKNMPSDNGKPA